MTDSNATNVTATARTVLFYARQSVADVATVGYLGEFPPGLNEAGETELRAAIQEEAKRLVGA